VNSIITPYIEIPCHAAEDSIEEKLKSFLNLDFGWNHGTGVATLTCVYSHALSLCSWLRENGLVELDVFPADDGGVMVSAFKGDQVVNVIINANEAYDIEVEKGIGCTYEIVLDQYDLCLFQVKHLITDEFILKEEQGTQWDTYELSTGNTMINVNNAIPALPLSPQQMAASLCFASVVPTMYLVASVST